MPAALTDRRCLRCLGAGRVERVDGGALGQSRDHASQPATCPDCNGNGTIKVVQR